MPLRFSTIIADLLQPSPAQSKRSRGVLPAAGVLLARVNVITVHVDSDAAGRQPAAAEVRHSHDHQVPCLCAHPPDRRREVAVNPWFRHHSPLADPTCMRGERPSSS